MPAAGDLETNCLPVSGVQGRSGVNRVVSFGTEAARLVSTCPEEKKLSIRRIHQHPNAKAWCAVQAIVGFPKLQLLSFFFCPDPSHLGLRYISKVSVRQVPTCTSSLATPYRHAREYLTSSCLTCTELHSNTSQSGSIASHHPDVRLFACSIRCAHAGQRSRAHMLCMQLETYYDRDFMQSASVSRTSLVRLNERLFDN